MAFAISEQVIGWIREISCSQGIEDLSRGFTPCLDLPFSYYSHRLEATNRYPCDTFKLACLYEGREFSGILKKSALKAVLDVLLDEFKQGQSHANHA